MAEQLLRPPDTVKGLGAPGSLPSLVSREEMIPKLAPVEDEEVMGRVVDDLYENTGAATVGGGVLASDDRRYPIQPLKCSLVRWRISSGPLDRVRCVSPRSLARSRCRARPAPWISTSPLGRKTLNPRNLRRPARAAALFFSFILNFSFFSSLPRPQARGPLSSLHGILGSAPRTEILSCEAKRVGQTAAPTPVQSPGG